MFCRLLTWYTLYTFLGLLSGYGILPGAIFTLHPSLALPYIGSVTARHSSSGHQPNFAALNRGLHLYSAGRPSRWALAHILVLRYFTEFVYDVVLKKFTFAISSPDKFLVLVRCFYCASGRDSAHAAFQSCQSQTLKYFQQSDHSSLQLTRMWANAQRDGRPAEYRCRPLLNAAKFG